MASSKPSAGTDWPGAAPERNGRWNKSLLVGTRRLDRPDGDDLIAAHNVVLGVHIDRGVAVRGHQLDLVTRLQIRAGHVEVAVLFAEAQDLHRQSVPLALRRPELARERLHAAVHDRHVAV